jgi:hypothetical protein
MVRGQGIMLLKIGYGMSPNRKYMMGYKQSYRRCFFPSLKKCEPPLTGFYLRVIIMVNSVCANYKWL